MAKKKYIIARVKKLTPSLLKNLKQKARKTKTPIAVKTNARQTGTTIVTIDKKRTAMPPGMRISRTGKVYYEYRKNRTDRKGRSV